MQYVSSIDDVKAQIESAEMDGYAEFSVPNYLREEAAKLCRQAAVIRDGRPAGEKILDAYQRVVEARKRTGRGAPGIYAEEETMRGSFSEALQPDGGYVFRLNLCADDFD